MTLGVLLGVHRVRLARAGKDRRFYFILKNLKRIFDKLYLFIMYKEYLEFIKNEINEKRA